MQTFSSFKSSFDIYCLKYTFRDDDAFQEEEYHNLTNIIKQLQLITLSSDNREAQERIIECKKIIERCKIDFNLKQEMLNQQYFSYVKDEKKLKSFLKNCQSTNLFARSKELSDSLINDYKKNYLREQTQNMSEKDLQNIADKLKMNDRFSKMEKEIDASYVEDFIFTTELLNVSLFPFKKDSLSESKQKFSLKKFFTGLLETIVEFSIETWGSMKELYLQIKNKKGWVYLQEAKGNIVEGIKHFVEEKFQGQQIKCVKNWEKLKILVESYLSFFDTELEELTVLADLHPTLVGNKYDNIYKEKEAIYSDLLK